MSDISATEIRRLAAALSAEDRLSLIDALWAGLDDAELPLTEAQVAELRHRQQRFDADLPQARPWPEVLAELTPPRA